MRVPFVDTRAQYNELKEQLDESVAEVLSSGAYVIGAHNKALEKEIAELHDVRFAVAVNSGTDALRIMLQAAGLGPGDEVITTAFTFVASVEAIVQTGATPVFVDIDLDTFNVDVSKVEAAITPKTKAVMPIHLFGQLAAVEDLVEITRPRDLIVLEDAAQAVATHHDCVYTGNWGQSAGLSFYVTKNLGAAGDGGMILTNFEDVAEKARSLRVHGMGRERYYYDDIGYTSRLDELQAAILRVKLTRLGAWNDRRRQLAGIYQGVLRDTPVALPKTAAGNLHTWHQYTVRAPRRDELQTYLKSLGVDSMIYYPVPLHFHEPYERYGHGPDSLPVTERACNEVLSLPIHQHLSDEQVAFAAESVREFYT